MEMPGFRTRILRDFLASFPQKWIPHNYTLHFFIDHTDVPGFYTVKWKVRNVGDEAKRRNCLRGMIEDPNDVNNGRKETSNFYGPHYVECYIIKNGIVVARDRILVPIEE